MRIWPVAARYSWLRALADEVARKRAAREEIPLRTVYNSRTDQFEDMPLPEFQQLLQRGEIQETVSRREGRAPRYVYRLV
jgi:hypothetical protein